MKNKIIILSDIHIGDNSPTCWYQKSVHEPYLAAILKWVIDNAQDVSELVLAGDVIDTWTYPFNVRPPVFTEIAAKNPNIFGLQGWLARALDALGGAVTYISGNHDMSVTEAVSPLSRAQADIVSGFPGKITSLQAIRAYLLRMATILRCSMLLILPPNGPRCLLGTL